MRISTFVSVAAALALACGSAFAAASNLIVPGQSIGLVTLGMPVDQLYSAMGEPKSSDVRDDKTSYTYDGLQVGVENDSQRVYRMFATSAKYKLDNGIAVGSSALAVAAALGEPAERHDTEGGDKTFCYGNFELYLRAGKVVAIMVSNGGCGSGFLYYFQ